MAGLPKAKPSNHLPPRYVSKQFSSSSSSTTGRRGLAEGGRQQRRVGGGGSIRCSSSYNGGRPYNRTIITFISVIMASIVGMFLLERETMYRQQIRDVESELYALKAKKSKKYLMTTTTTTTTPPPPLASITPSQHDISNYKKKRKIEVGTTSITQIQQQEYVKIEFIPPNNLQTQNPPDFFSAAWWQNKERFLELDIDKYIFTVEDDGTKPVTKVGKGKADLRMPEDYLDFSVEHLSKWWKLDRSKSNTMYYAIGKLQIYIQSTLRKFHHNQQYQQQQQQSSSSSPPSAQRQSSSEQQRMKSTLAIIPVGVNAEESTPISNQMWTISLAATISSLLKHGIGRVVVVGYYNYDPILTRKAFKYILRHHPEYQKYVYGVKNDNKGNTSTSSSTTTIINATNYSIPELNKTSIHQPFSVKYGQSELAYCNTDDVKTKFVTTNIPKGALKGLQIALKGTNMSSSDITAWLGGNGNHHEKYKYIFLTEADQILNTRLDSKSGFAFMEELDSGHILVPHRLQPIPHSLDLDGIASEPNPHESKTVVTGLSEIEEFVHDLDSDNDSCCDTNQRMSSKEKYGITNFWWMHGFQRGSDKSFEYLKEYEFMRLVHGTGIVHLAATPHSRKCHPVINHRSCT